MPDLLHIHDLTLGFRGHPPVVEHVQLEVQPGESVGLSGVSGAGKSVLARSLLGLLDAELEVRSGHVAYQTKEGLTLNLFELSNRQRAGLRGREIGLVFQDPHQAFNPVQPLGHQLLEGIRSLRPNVTAPRSYVRQLLQQVELPDDHDRMLRALPGALSGGQLQRMVIALALLGAPRLLIADEPTTSLDAVNQLAVVRLLDRLRHELQLSLIFITHDAELLRRCTDRVVAIGKTYQPTEYVRRAPELSHEERPIALRVDGVRLSYPKQQTPVLQGVDCILRRGEWIALTGVSGCGKSTFARWLVGLLPARSGRVDNGTASLSLPATGECVRDHTGAQLIFQNVDQSLNPRQTVRQHLTRTGVTAGAPSVDELLELVELPAAQYGDRYVHTLSGGQRQRVAIARALRTAPRILVFDESFSGLDRGLRNRLLVLLDRLLRPRGVTALFITHDLRQARGTVDRVLVMDGGSIVEDTVPEELFLRPQTAVARQLVEAAQLRLP